MTCGLSVSIGNRVHRGMESKPGGLARCKAWAPVAGTHTWCERTVDSGHVNLQAPWRVWNDSLRLVEEGQFSDGGELGHWTYWYPSSTKKVEGSYVGGQRPGVWKEWYEDSTLKWEGTRLNGKLDGRQMFWHKNGEKSCESERVAGEWHFYSEEGKEIQAPQALDDVVTAAEPDGLSAGTDSQH
jgi:hypothetical protein